MLDTVCCSTFLSMAVRSISQSWPRQELSIGNERKRRRSQGGDKSRRKLTSSSCFFSFLSLVFRFEFPRLHVEMKQYVTGTLFPYSTELHCHAVTVAPLAEAMSIMFINTLVNYGCNNFNNEYGQDM